MASGIKERTDAETRRCSAAADDLCAPLDDLALVGLIHEGIYEPQPWRSFLHALRTRANAGYANVIFRRPGQVDDGLIEWRDADEPADHIKDRYFSAFAGLDPFPYFQMPPGRVLTIHEMMGVDYRDHPYFTGFLKPNGLAHMLLFRVVEPRGHQAWVTLTRPRDEQDFSREMVDLCTRLAPHFATALRSYGELEAARLTREIRDRVMRKLNFGCVTVDARRRIVRPEESAGGIGGPVIVDAAGKVRLASAGADRELGALLAQIGGGAGLGPQALTAQGEERHDLLVVPIDPAIAGASAAIATIYFQAPAVPEPEDGRREQRLRELFGLSGTEARLALKLAQGRTLAEAAIEISITVESARTYSKRIFAKTGTARQADLVRTLLQSVAALA